MKRKSFKKYRRLKRYKLSKKYRRLKLSKQRKYNKYGGSNNDKRKIKNILKSKTICIRKQVSPKMVLAEFNPIKLGLDYESKVTFEIGDHILFLDNENENNVKNKLNTQLKPIFKGYDKLIEINELKTEFNVIDTFRGLKTTRRGSGNKCWMNALFQVLFFHTQVITEFLYNGGTILNYKDSEPINLLSKCIIDYKNTSRIYDTKDLEKLIIHVCQKDDLFGGNNQEDPGEGFNVLNPFFEKYPKYKCILDLDESDKDVIKTYLNKDNRQLHKEDTSIYCSFLFYLFRNITDEYIICINDISETDGENFIKEKFKDVKRTDMDLEKENGDFIIKKKRQNQKDTQLQFVFSSEEKKNKSIIEKREFTLENLITSYQKIEQLADDEKFNKCKEKNLTSFKYNKLNFISKYIYIRLIREGKGGSKLNNKVKFDDIYTFGTNQYRLYGVISHIGSSSTSGHYIAYIKCNKTNTKNSVIYKKCDGSIENLTEFTVNNIYDDPNETPFYLCYERLD